MLWIRNDLFRIQLRFLEFRNLEIIKNTLKVIKKKNLSTICLFLFYTTVLQYDSPESSGLKIMNNILIYLLFHSCWIRNNNPVPGKSSGSDRIWIWIHNTAFIYRHGSVGSMGPSANGGTAVHSNGNTGDLKGYSFESVATQQSAWQAYKALVYIRFIRKAALPATYNGPSYLTEEFLNNRHTAFNHLKSS